jgi:hypothetical protein
MRARFVPPSYRRDLRKIATLISERHVGTGILPRASERYATMWVVEDPEDQMVRFYGGLRREIQDIVDYKEYHSIQCLFHLSMLTEKEWQGRQQRRSSTFAPR